MNEEKTHTKSSAGQSHGPQEAALAAICSIHYITMGLYTLGFIGTAGNLLLSILQGESGNLRAYSLLTLLPVVLFFIHLMAVRGLNKRQPWAYQASRWLGFLLLLLFPFGTVLGLFLLSQLSKFRLDNQGLVDHE